MTSVILQTSVSCRGVPPRINFIQQPVFCDTIKRRKQRVSAKGQTDASPAAAAADQEECEAGEGGPGSRGRWAQQWSKLCTVNMCSPDGPDGKGEDVCAVYVWEDLLPNDVREQEA